MANARATILWLPSLGLSLAVHLGAGFLILATITPRPLIDQQAPRSELRIETQEVAQSQAQKAPSQGQAAASASTEGVAAAPGTVPQSRASAAQPQAQRLSAAPPPALVQPPAASSPAEKLAPAPAPAATQAVTAPATALAEVQAPSQPAALAPATGDTMVATLAFSGDQAQIDPTSLNAIAAFMRPGDTTAQADETRDALTDVLSSVPCARLQAEFNPETGSLDLRGHVPDAGLKGPVLAALQAQLGEAIQVNDAMLILPRPQCGALSGIAEVGLPQSQDQLTNPRLIGADAQARAYDYRQGQSLVLDLAAPDYDAYVYVDYFAADGTVLHLMPNDTVALKLRPAKSALRVGAPDAEEPFLNITIGPPYGQEIAAAFAASAPLYDGVRPLSEPAEPYLAWLKDQVSAARAADPDFKGEWVYFFISTRE